MFSAVQKDGKTLYLFPRHSRKWLQEKKQNEEFFCPECKEKVVLKLGRQRMEHFAHQKGTHCTEGFERESDYHMSGKLQLYQWLEEKKLNPVLEPYYPSIRQRPDVAFFHEQKSYALEFQCSAIPPDLMEKRTKQYRRIQSSVLWILGGKNINRKGERKVALTNFDYFFAAKSPAGSWFIPAYCPAAKIFILLNNLTPITTKNAFANLSIIPFHQFTLERLFAPSHKYSFSSEEWKREIRSQKLNLQMRCRKPHDLVHELYSLGLNISLLPPFIGIPVRSAILLESPPLIWQTYLFMDHLFSRKAGEIFTVNDIFHGFARRLDEGMLHARILPLASDYSQLTPIMEYLHVLEKVRVLESLNTNTFKLIQKVEVPDHVVRQQNLEEQFYKQYEKMLFF
ncbi:competence protein CoiA [Bacillus benzoevorans]|uniref:Competence CoiA-like predicted nuclease n=1 Tax=Bacillus benzoevorans TaxID=1456 RepID=A0A7X0HMI3_9BACI|nr:competence protein CoiA family protein [Bacillus benzoevorans]MBB6443550.1 competence CoiA-like predicted nuclease [Bacillus benzoevorans]